MNPYQNNSSRGSLRLRHLTPVPIPRDKMSNEDLAPASSIDETPGIPLPLAGHLLLIDEAGADASSLRSLLVSEVLRVISVDSSVQGFLAARSGQYDVIVSRLNAGLVNPFKGFDMLQSNGLIDGIPFIYVAKEEDMHLSQAALDRGADDVLIIPLAAHELSQALAARLHRWRTRGSELTTISDSRSALDMPFSSRTVDASVIVRGACQAHTRQRERGTVLLDVEKVRVSSPITSLLRVILTLLQALDTREERPTTLRISLKQVDQMAVLTIRTSASETELAPALVLSSNFPDHLEPISRAVALLEGTFEYGSHPLYPAARVSIPGV